MTLDEFKNSVQGQRLAPLLADGLILARMEELARAGRPAVKAIDDAVATHVGPLNNTERQHVGRWVRDVLARRGWRPIKQLEWRGGKAFSSGAVYARVAGPTTAVPSVRAETIEQRMVRVREILRAGRIDPSKPLDTVDAFLADRRRMWGEA